MSEVGSEVNSDVDAEKTIMARLRGTTQRAGAVQVRAALEALGSAPEPTPAQEEDLLVVFKRHLERNGASVAVVADRAAAVTEIARYVTGRYGQRRIVTGHDQRLAALPWRDGGLLPRFGGAQPGDAVSVSYATDGVAETGSVALWLDRNNPASNNLLTEDQVVLLDRAALRRNLEDVWEHPELGPDAPGPRGLMLVSGPSSTADIGMQLIKGAHGPRALHVVVVGEALTGRES